MANYNDLYSTLCLAAMFGRLSWKAAVAEKSFRCRIGLTSQPYLKMATVMASMMTVRLFKKAILPHKEMLFLRED
jgi:hypothetical protein